MPRFRSGDLTVAAIAVAAIAVFAVLGAVVTPGGTSAGGRGSSYSSAPDGAKAAFLALKQLGYRVDRSYEPLTAIASPAAETTIVLASPAVATSDQDRRALRTFIEGGGIVIATGAGGATVLGARMQRAESQFTLDPEIYTAALPSPLASGAGEITMEIEASASFDDAYLSVYGEDHGSAVRTARFGTGRAIWWAGSTPMTNASVAERGNFALLLNAIGGRHRAVLWDEHYHGYSRSLWSYVKQTPLPWLAVQAGLVALAAALTFTRRREPVRPPAVDARTSPMEFVETVGGLYARAGAASAAVSAARERLRRLLLVACGLAPTTSDERLARAAAPRLDMDARALTDLLARAARDARNLSLGTDEALPVVQELQGAAGAVVSARSRRHRGRST